MAFSKIRVSELMLLFVALIWGTSYGVAKSALVFYPVLGFLAIRFIMTFVLLLPYLLKYLKQALLPGLVLGTILLGIFLAETFGVSQTSASNAAFLISLCVVFTPFAEWAIFRRRPAAVSFGTAGVSLFGAYLLTSSSAFELNQGDFLIIIAAVLRSLMVCFTKLMLRSRNVPPLALTAVQVGVVGFGCLAFLLFSPGSIPKLPTEISFWGATIYLVLFCTLFAFYAQNVALRDISPSRASLLMGSEPLFGACFAVLWLNEQLTIVSWCGGLLIVIASLLGARPERAPKLVRESN